MTDRVTALRAELEPIVESLDLSIYDVTLGGGDRPTLTVILQRQGGVDLDSLETATRTISVALDAMDPLKGRYLLEVSSPGLERPLRTAEHFRAATGEVVTLKTRAVDGQIVRLRGTVVGVHPAAESDATASVRVAISTDVGEETVALDAIESARTVFVWGPAPKPGRGSRPGQKKPGPKQEVAAR